MRTGFKLIKAVKVYRKKMLYWNISVKMRDQDQNICKRFELSHHLLSMFVLSHHLLSTYATFSEKLTFLTPRYTDVRVRIRG